MLYRFFPMNICFYEKDNCNISNNYYKFIGYYNLFIQMHNNILPNSIRRYSTHSYICISVMSQVADLLYFFLIFSKNIIALSFSSNTANVNVIDLLHPHYYQSIFRSCISTQTALVCVEASIASVQRIDVNILLSLYFSAFGGSYGNLYKAHLR